MSYKLNKPYTKEQRIDFIVKYNHNLGLRIEETKDALYALEQNEIMVNGIPQIDPEWEEKQAQIERERLDMLSLTKREVFLALYKSKGMTPEQLKEQIKDPQNLIEFEYANEYYRGNPLINLIGEQLGFTSSELDYLFEYGKLPIKEED